MYIAFALFLKLGSYIFKINDKFYVVGLPGYGFAKVPKAMKEQWGKTLSGYVGSRRNKIVFVLLDIRRIPSDEDIEMLQFLEHNDIDYKIIFTKVDKLSGNEKFRALKDIKTKLVFESDDVFFHSSLNHKGREDILNYMESMIK